MLTRVGITHRRFAGPSLRPEPLGDYHVRTSCPIFRTAPARSRTEGTCGSSASAGVQRVLAFVPGYRPGHRIRTPRDRHRALRWERSTLLGRHRRHVVRHVLGERHHRDHRGGHPSSLPEPHVRRPTRVVGRWRLPRRFARSCARHVDRRDRCRAALLGFARFERSVEPGLLRLAHSCHERDDATLTRDRRVHHRRQRRHRYRGEWQWHQCRVEGRLRAARREHAQDLRRRGSHRVLGRLADPQGPEDERGRPGRRHHRERSGQASPERATSTPTSSSPVPTASTRRRSPSTARRSTCAPTTACT